MKLAQKPRVLIFAVIFIVIQLAWYAAVEVYAHNYFTLTKATVTGFEDTGKCSGNILIRSRERPCTAPIYEYRRSDGTTAKYTDRYTTSFNERSIFKKSKGDVVTAYSSRNINEEPFFRSGILANTAWLLPLYLAITLAIIYGIVKLIKVLVLTISS